MSTIRVRIARARNAHFSFAARNAFAFARTTTPINQAFLIELNGMSRNLHQQIDDDNLLHPPRVTFLKTGCDRSDSIIRSSDIEIRDDQIQRGDLLLFKFRRGPNF